MKVIKACSIGVAVATVLCAAYSFGQSQKAILNAKQLGIEDLDLDLGLEEDLVVPAKPADTVSSGVEVSPADETVTDASASEATEETVRQVSDGKAEAPSVDNIEETNGAVVEDPVVDSVLGDPVVDAVLENPATVVEPAVDTPATNNGSLQIKDLLDQADIDEPVAVVETADEPVAVVETADEPVAVVETADEPVAVVETADEPVAVVETADEPVAVVETADEPVAVVETADEPVAVVETADEPVAVVEAADEPVAVVEPLVVEVEAPVPTSEDVAVSELATLENARRRLFEQHGRDSLAQGQTALLTGNWDRSADKFKEALKFLVEKDTTIPLRKEAEAGLAEAYYRKALELRSINNLEESLKSAREARIYQHPKAEKLITAIQDQQENPPPPPPPKHERRWNQLEYQNNVVDINARMKIAKEYYATDELAKCREQVELILREYPWYEDAVNMLRKINIAEHKYVDNERLTARELMMKDVTKAWAPRNYGIDFSAGPEKLPADPTNPSGLGGTAEMKILDKMRSITIPEIDFRQANITDVVTFLSEASREHDRQDIPPEERGVNIVLNLGGTVDAPAAAATADDPWAAAVSAPAASSGNVPPLTINARFLTMLSALEMIMDLADLKYRVRDNVVLIMEANKPDGQLIHRMYNVLPSINERVVSIAGTSGNAGAAANPFGNAIAGGETTETTDWKKFFGDLGVNWPDGSTVQYMSSIGKMVVLNTSKNLSTLEEVLAVLNVTPKQVEIEVRFVEVGQSDLDSLGFEWTLNDDWEMAEMKADANLPPAARRRVTMGAGSVTRGFNYLSNNNSKDINDGSSVMDNVATFTSILTNPELSVVLHMLSSKQNTDLLSAPKVVAQAGVKATIKVVTEYIYPTEYDVEMLESTSGNSDTTTYSGAVVEPQNFTMREVGVILEVTPEVTPDGSMINLSLTPSVVSEPTWKNYGSTYPVSTATGTDLLGNQTYQTEYVQLPMEQPFFPVRSLATSVQIYNGATVVMGGMITEQRYTNEDKIPFLGDIPILGQFFRNKYELSEKRNLLLFVTARLVDPAGREVKESAANAVSLLGTGM